ncbi:MAG: FKBP-type peptidyl-prolyl cis-trans isomerase [Eubacterium sp.]|nr:FKBP-type peptidyl-prolyl cis-trans isomerase [Eubacterium sp.]
MKRRQVMILLMAATLAAGSILAGCGGSSSSSASSAASSSASSAEEAVDAEDETDEESLDEEDAEQAEYDAWLDGLALAEDDVAVEDCITLGEYKGLKLTKEVTKITDDAVKSYAEDNLDTEEVTDENAVVQDGDIANIAYVGEKDGVAFDGGTSDSYDLEIGSGTFIDGFEDGVIGMKKGETKDLNLKFPDDYGSEELAGQEVVFHVTVNSISRTKELTDADLEAARTDLAAEYEEEANSLMYTDAWQQIKDASEIKQIRKSKVDEYLAQTEVELQSWIESLGMTKEQYLEEQGYTEEEYNKEMERYARDMAVEDLLVEALSKEEGISAEDQDYKDRLAKLAEDSGITEEELTEQAGEAAVYQYIMTERLMERIVSYAEVTETEVEQEDENYEDYDYIDVDDSDIEYEDVDEEDPDAEDGDEDDTIEVDLDEDADDSTDANG